MKLKVGKKTGLKYFDIKDVRKDLIKNGFTISNKKPDTANGIDIQAFKKGEFISIEVKKVIYSQKAKTVKPVQKSGKNCDWIALVFRNHIVYQPMKEHLKLCGPNGTRGVTELKKLIEMVKAEGLENIKARGRG